jgi:hypothetical protein
MGRGGPKEHAYSKRRCVTIYYACMYAWLQTATRMGGVGRVDGGGSRSGEADRGGGQWALVGVEETGQGGVPFGGRGEDSVVGEVVLG